MSTTTQTALRNWIPYKLQEQTNTHWLYTGLHPYIEPFFDDTIFKCKLLAENRHRQRVVSTCSMLEEWSLPDALSPTAIIFHVSRCGSTLLAQLLGLDKKHISLSEVPFFDNLLRSKFTGQDLSAYLPHALSFYARKRNGDENRLFIKTDSWHLFFYEQWRMFYPSTPFILLYRRPDETIFSQEKKKGMHAVPGIIEKEIFPPDTLPSDFHLHPNNYVAAVLEQYYLKMQQIKAVDTNTYLMNYNEGFTSIAQKVYQLTGTPLKEDTRQAFEKRCAYDAKEPAKEFNNEKTDDSKIEAYMEKAFAAYNNLETLRTQVI